MWGGALISALLGTQFPGPGTIYLQQDLHFTRPVRVGDTLTVEVKVLTKDDAKKHLALDCRVSNQKGEAVLHGTARVLAPPQKVRRRNIDAPHIQPIDPQAHFKALLAQRGDLAWLGVQIDDALNRQATGDVAMAIHAPHSRIEVWVIPTDEGRIAAQEAERWVS